MSNPVKRIRIHTESSQGYSRELSIFDHVKHSCGTMLYEWFVSLNTLFRTHNSISEELSAITLTFTTPDIEVVYQLWVEHNQRSIFGPVLLFSLFGNIIFFFQDFIFYPSFITIVYRIATILFSFMLWMVRYRSIDYFSGPNLFWWYATVVTHLGIFIIITNMVRLFDRTSFLGLSMPSTEITVFSPALSILMLLIVTSIKFTFKQSTYTVLLLYALLCMSYFVFYITNITSNAVIVSDLISYASIVCSGIWVSYHTELNQRNRFLLVINQFRPVIEKPRTRRHSFCIASSTEHIVTMPHYIADEPKPKRRNSFTITHSSTSTGYTPLAFFQHIVRRVIHSIRLYTKLDRKFNRLTHHITPLCTFAREELEVAFSEIHIQNYMKRACTTLMIMFLLNNLFMIQDYYQSRDNFVTLVSARSVISVSFVCAWICERFMLFPPIPLQLIVTCFLSVAAAGYSYHLYSLLQPLRDSAFTNILRLVFLLQTTFGIQFRFTLLPASLIVFFLPLTAIWLQQETPGIMYYTPHLLVQLLFGSYTCYRLENEWKALFFFSRAF